MRIATIDEALSRELRRAELRPELEPGDPLPGDDLPAAVHFGVLDDDGVVLSTCFVYLDPCPWRPGDQPAWHLRQMATRAAYRGQGLGAAVLGAALEYVTAEQAVLLWCNARERALAFYSRYGFQPYGEIFTDERHPIPHQRMSLPIPNRQTWREGP